MLCLVERFLEYLFDLCPRYKLTGMSRLLSTERPSYVFSVIGSNDREPVSVTAPTLPAAHGEIDEVQSQGANIGADLT